jgi:hypothetical protein
MKEAQRLTPGYADMIEIWIQVARVTAGGVVCSQIIRPTQWPFGPGFIGELKPRAGQAVD